MTYCAIAAADGFVLIERLAGIAGACARRLGEVVPAARAPGIAAKPF
jgi:hypothetical protein